MKGTRTYERLKKAYDKGLPLLKLTTTISSKTVDSPINDQWGTDFKSLIVHTECVIGYWSRTFKSVETRYLMTEQEALVVKEGLVKFQPFIKGETVLLVMDHSALQWARTYENSNHRLAAWGAVFSAYSPKLEIIHHAGRVHSNVDPLSHLPQAPLDHILPLEGREPSIVTDSSLAEEQERQMNTAPAKEAFVIWSVDQCLDGVKSAWATAKEGEDAADKEDLDTLPVSEGYWDAANPAPNLHVSMDCEFLKEWVTDYEDNPSFRKIWTDNERLAKNWKGNR